MRHGHRGRRSSDAAAHHQHGEVRPRPGRTLRAPVIGAVVLLIAYGSLYPFAFTPPASFGEACLALLGDWSLTTSKGDALGNLALFLPFGFAAVFAVPGARRPAVLPALLCAFAVATLLQIVQIYFPPRAPAMADVMWNMIGTAFGMTGAIALRSIVPYRAVGHNAHAVSLILLVLWLSAELLPFVPSLDMQLVKNSVKAVMRLHLGVPDIAWHAAGVLLGGRALAAMMPRRAACAWLAVLAFAVVAGKIVIVTRELNASTIAGVALGYIAWLLVSARPGIRDASVAVALVAAYTLKGIFPMDLVDSPSDFNWVPFAGMLQGSMLINAQVIVEHVYIYAGVLSLVRMNGHSVVGSTVLLALWVAMIEWAQIYMAGRTPDITQPLLVLLVGALLQHRALSPPHLRAR